MREELTIHTYPWVTTDAMDLLSENVALKAEVERLEAFRDDVEAVIDAEGPSKLPHALIDRVSLCATDAVSLEEAVGLLRGSSVRYGNGPAVDKEIRAFLAKHPASAPAKDAEIDVVTQKESKQ